MFQKLPVLCIGTALMAVLACAQPPSGSPPDPQTMAQRRVEFLTGQLSLTDSQKASALTIFTNAITAGQSLQSSLQTNRQSVSDAIKTNNTAMIDQLSAAAGALDGQLMAINSKAEAAFYAILTTDQQSKYHPRGGGFGGPMGPPPGGPGPQFRRSPGQ